MLRFSLPRGGSRSALCAALTLTMLLATGCVCRFERDWRAAKRCGVPCDNLAGLWEGTWESDYNGHNGRLRAIITRCADGRYHSRYHATFAAIIPYAYDTTHTATPGAGVTWFCGEEDLGWLAGGTYHTNGQADGQSFVARYQADKDHGTFRMCRVGPCKNQPDSCLPAHCAAIPITTAPAPPEVVE